MRLHLHLHLLLVHLHVHALDLDQPAHLSRTRVTLSLAIYAQALHAGELTWPHLVLHLHLLRGLPVLQVVLHVAEDAVEVHCVQLDGHLGGRVLRV